MNRRFAGHAIGLFAIGVVVAHASDAAAFWALVPGNTCTQSVLSSASASSIADGATILLDATTAPAGGLGESVVCPFVDSSLMPDTGVTSASVDLVNPMGTTLAAGAVSASACVYTNFTSACGSSLPNTAIAAGGHAGIWLDLSKWTHDANGYAMVAVTTNPGTGVLVAGVHYN